MRTAKDAEAGRKLPFERGLQPGLRPITVNFLLETSLLITPPSNMSKITYLEVKLGRNKHFLFQKKIKKVATLTEGQ